MTTITEIPTIATLPAGVEFAGPLAVPTLAAAQAFAEALGYSGGYFVTSNKQAFFTRKDETK